MGQKVNPNLIRLGITKCWNSIWYAPAPKFKLYIKEDFLIRKYLYKKLNSTYISKIIIKRFNKKIKIIIFTSFRPLFKYHKKNKNNLNIFKKGNEAIDLDMLTYYIMNNYTNFYPKIKIKQIIKSNIDSKLIANNISILLKKRFNYKILIKKAIQKAMKQGVKGIKIKLSGRLGGVDIARKEWQKEGGIPLHTFRANIDYATCNALTTYGLIGIKVWLFKKEISNILDYNKFYIEI